MTPEHRLIIKAEAYIDRAMMPFVRKYPGLEPDFRSRAHLQLCRAAPAALKTDNPMGYMLITITNAFRVTARTHLRERRRSRLRSLDSLMESAFQVPGFVPRPDLVAMAREEIALRDVPPPVPVRHAIQPDEWAAFDRIVRSNPAWNNRRIADEFNRKTGRKLNVYSVSAHRRRRGLGSSRTPSSVDGPSPVRRGSDAF
jgi:hypothetical protein